MKMYKKYLLSIFVLFMAYTVMAPNTASAFWPFDWLKKDTVVQTENTAAVQAFDTPSICQIVELFISLGIIPPDKANAARQAVSGYCSSSSSSSSSNNGGGGGGGGNNSSSSISSSSKPSITVLSPNGGEICKVGAVCKISWAYKNINPNNNYVGIYLLKADKAVYQPYGSPIGEINQYDWYIPSNINNLDVINGGNDYRMKIFIFNYTTGQTQAMDTSDNMFTIVGNSSSSSSKPSITVISPNGGEKWALGSPQVIRWSAPSDIPKVVIAIHGQVYPYYTYTITNNEPNDGQFTWIGSKDISGKVVKPGDYKLDVSDPYTHNPTILDNSDMPFTIASSSSSSSSSLFSLSNFSAKSSPIDNGSNPPATSSVRFAFTFNNNSISPVYVSKKPHRLVSTSTTAMSGRLTLLRADLGVLAGDTSNAYVIPDNSSRTFILEGSYGNSGGKTGYVEFRINKIYFGNRDALRAGNITQGLENLKVSDPLSSNKSL